MRLDGELDNLATLQHGCVAIWQVRELGASATEISRVRRATGWHELSRRVLMRTGSPRTPEQEACAAVLEAGARAALASFSAAALWELGASYPLLPAWVLADRLNASISGDIGHILQRRGIPDRWITTHNGIAVVRPELCIYMLCGLVNQMRAERALDTGLSMGLVTIPSLRLCLKELRKQGRNGTIVLDGLLRVRPIDYVPTASGLEARFHEIVGRGWRRQVDSGAEMWAGRVDFRHEVHPVICEVLSERYHAALSFRRDDAIRRAKLKAAGFIIVEAWDRQVWHEPHEVRRIVCAGILSVPATQMCVAGTDKMA